jgi:pimeloyl-ACP methyl ester carboxylesterase
VIGTPKEVREMATFVLVHGGWSGAHGFRKVRPLLRDAGHEVFTPSLTGIGERSHLTSPSVNLTTHIRDVVNVVLYEDLADITLLGFSYGGFVVTGTLDHIADRVRHLVYLDAFVPGTGDTVAGLAGSGATSMITLNAGWFVPPPPRQFDEPEEAAWQNERRTQHPLSCFTEAVHLAQPLEDSSFTRTYIKATAEKPGAPGSDAFWSAAEMAKASSAWRYREIATTHMVASNRPADLARVLLELD